MGITKIKEVFMQKKPKENKLNHLKERIKIIKQIGVLFLIAVMLISVITSCDTNNGVVENTTVDTQQTTDTEEAKDESLLELFKSSQTEYKIIRSDEADDITVEAATSLKSEIDSKSGATFEIKDDWQADANNGETVYNAELEILVGQTNRQESREIYDTLVGDEYSVCIKNNKLILIGRTSIAAEAAVQAFIDEYLVLDNIVSLTIPKDLLMTGSQTTREISLCAGTQLRIMTFNIKGVSEDIATRAEYVVDSVLFYLPDILGMQEVQGGVYAQVIDKLDSYYKVAECMHANGLGTANYTPILYRYDRFTLVTAGVEWLESRYTGTNTKSISWAVFDDNQTGVRFGVINLHGAILSNSYTGYENMTSAQMSVIEAEWCVDNVRQMLEIMTDLKSVYGEIPFMFTGDFNSTRVSDALKNAVSAGLSEAEMTAVKRQCIGYKTSHTIGTAPITGYSIDHIFATSSVTFGYYGVGKTECDLAASDHCPVYADISFNK